MEQNPNLQHKPEIGTFEAARLIGVSVPTVRALTDRGELAGWKIGKCYKFSRQAIDQFLKRSERPAAVAEAA
jgi:excisionase family DNA binding protein